MDVFVKLLGLLFGLGILTVGSLFLFRSKKVVQSIQKRKFGKTAEPRKEELVFSKVIGGLLFLMGLYYAVFAFLSLL
jgi:hypothetical protein